MKRRTFISFGLLQFGGLVSLAGLAGSCSESCAHGSKGQILYAGAGEVYYIGNRRKAKVTIKISKASDPCTPMSLLSEIIPPGDYIPVHQHLNEDEFIFIYRGNASVFVEHEEQEMLPGDLAFIPRKKWHGLKNKGNEYVHMIFGYSPAGFEDYFRAIGTKSIKDKTNLSPEAWEETSKKYGVIYR